MKTTQEVELWECDARNCHTRYVGKGEQPTGFHLSIQRVFRDVDERGKIKEGEQQHQAWACTKTCLIEIVTWGLSDIKHV